MNNQNAYDIQIEAYYSGTMLPEERQSFEQALATDKKLQEAIKPFQMFEAAVAVQGEAELSTMMRRIVAESAPVPTPTLRFWERISLFLTKTTAAPKQRNMSLYGIITGLSAAVIACLLYANIVVLPLSDLATSKTFSFTPESVGTLGADSQTAFADAQKLYESGQKESLQRMTIADTISRSGMAQNALIGGVKFVAAQYYLAHLELKNKNNSAAITAFDIVLQPRNKAILEAESMNIGRVKINRALAIIAQNPDKANAVKLLEQLSADPDCLSELAKIEAIQKEINNPWRILNWQD